MIPVSAPIVGDHELELVGDAVRSGWISSNGDFLEQFEADWAKYCGRRYGVAVTSGTTALQLAVAALGLQPDDEVIIPSFTIISCALAVLAAGARPVLVDADPDHWAMDVGAIEARITERTRAIMPVHLYGHPADMSPILKIAKDHGLAVIEDAAEAHGAEYSSDGGETWRRCGSFGTMSCFSFYANKLVTTGEGGMVLTDDEALAERLRILRNLGFEGERRFVHRKLGFNFRMTNVQAAIGVAQIKRIVETIDQKRRIAARYRAGLDGVGGISLAVERQWARSVWWMNGIVLGDQSAISASELGARLRDNGVESRPFFVGMHRQPALLDLGLFHGEDYPETDRLASRGIYLPSGPRLSLDEQAQVIDAVKGLLQ